MRSAKSGMMELYFQGGRCVAASLLRVPHSAFQSLQPTHLTAKLVAVVLNEGIGYGLKVAADNLIELIDREADAMVGEPIVGKVVGADFIATVTTAEHRLAFCRPLLLLFLLIMFVKTRFEDAKGFAEVLMLALLIL